MKKPKPPDRWEKMAERIRLEHTGSPWSSLNLTKDWPTIENRIAIAMRREHRAVVEMVRGSMYISKNALLTRDQRIEQDVYRDILAKLKARGQ
jgi:hypothetical protein